MCVCVCVCVRVWFFVCLFVFSCAIHKFPFICSFIRYKWYWNGVEVEAIDGRTYDADTGVLTIGDFTVEKEGIFHCRAIISYPKQVHAVALSPKIEARVAREYLIVPLKELLFSKHILSNR